MERQPPDDVTTTWWRKDRDPAKLFVDYNQNAQRGAVSISQLLELGEGLGVGEIIGAISVTQEKIGVT